MFGGHGSLKNALNNNKRLLRKKNIFRKEDTFIGKDKYDQKSYKGDLDLPKVSDEKLKSIKRNIQKESKSEGLKRIFLFFIGAIIFTISAFFYFKEVKINEANKLLEQKEVYFKEHIDKFTYLIKDGDYWLENEEYYNAIFQYKLAIKIFPNDSVANFKLLESYQLRCLKAKKDCIKAEDLEIYLKKHKTYTQRKAI